MCLSARISDPTWLWHVRMGHINFNSMKFMAKKKLIEGMPKLNIPPQPCEGCLVGKQTRNPFPTHTSYIAKKRLELIHGDLCGPVSPPTPSGNRYFMLLVDDYSRVMWVYLLKTKDEALQVFKNFKGKVEVEIGEKMKGEAVTYSVYVLNRAHTKALKESTPYKMWTGRKPHVDHLRVFRCVAHMRVAKGHLKKLDKRSMQLVHLGVEKGTKAYRLLDPNTGKIYVSRDVVFEEPHAWMWENSTKIKETPGMSFTVEGFNLDELYIDEDESELRTPQQGVGSPQSDSNWTENSQPIDSQPIDSHSSPQSIPVNPPGGGAPKRYRLLTDLYDETEEIDELMMIRSDEEPVKRDPSGKILKQKARIVAKGYVQKQGIDYDEVFAPVTRIETVRVILALSGSNRWRVHHLDVKSAFLNGALVKRGEVNKVYKLSKALYGLKQAPRAWNACLDKYLKSLGFTRCAQEYSVYTKKEGENILIIGVYVDDLLVTGNCHKSIQDFKKDMKAKFEMSDLGPLTYYLGIEVSQKETGITLKQEAYARSILSKTRMIDCNPTKSPMEHKLKLTKDGEGELVNPTEYRSIVGGLRYLTHTRPDISFAVGVVSRFMEKPTEQHLQAVKRILRYVKGTLDYGLTYTKGESKVTITGYSDSDLANDVNDRKSTGGMAFYVNGNLVTWASQKQRVVALSSCEAEFMAATMAACQGIWLRQLLTNITGQNIPPVIMYVDNRSALDLMKNPVFHGRSKHIDIRFHFIRECVEKGEITVTHVCGKEQKADLLTKPLARVKHEEMRDLIGVRKIGSSELRGEMLK
ncbi:zinc finger, CCHC-type containing protein [Tanacetum coccineum]